ncbi:MAG: phosphoglucosamine mutase [bacterium]
MKRTLFGTDGVRGVANVEPMTAETAMRLGRALAHRVRAAPGHRTRILIGKDTRLSGYMLEEALGCGIVSMGVDALFVGPLPTPGIAFLVQDMRANAGAVISASHNPFQDNGIKFFAADGYKLPDRTEAEIEQHVLSGEIDAIRPTADAIGKVVRIYDSQGRYVVYLKSTFPKGRSLEGLKIVLDCANGAGYRVAPAVFEELGADVIPIGVEPDGRNINAGCGSTHPENMARVVRERGADLGVALDGDADRVVFVDHTGSEVDGDRILAMTALAMHRRGALKNATVVATVMSNLGLDHALRGAGIRLLRTDVGDRYVVEEMRRGGHNLGGEQSGHIVFLDHATTGDGILSALQVLATMLESGKSLAELKHVMETVPQTLVNVRVKHKRPFAEVPEIATAIDRATRALAERGRILVRYSGTEALARVMIEGDDPTFIGELAGDLARTIERVLG